MMQPVHFSAKKIAVLRHLLQSFPAGETFSEPEVDERIRAALPGFPGVDPADERFEVTHLRRGMIEVGYLAREVDGSRYWRGEESRDS